MNDPSEVTRLRKLLEAWDDGIITLGEFEMLARRESFESSVFSHIENNKVHYSFSAGAFCGPLKHHYGLFDISSQSQGFYSFSLKNIIRFCWNKLCRYIKWYKEWIF